MFAFVLTCLMLASAGGFEEGSPPADDRAPLSFADAQSQYLQNASGLLPLRVRWRLRVRYGDAYSKLHGGKGGRDTKTEFREFWTDGASWRALVPWGKVLHRLPATWLTGSPREVAMRACGFHVLVYDCDRDKLTIVSEGESHDVTAAAILRDRTGLQYVLPPLTPVRPRCRAVLEPALHLMDKVMSGKWLRTRHLCPSCKPDDPIHYFELLGDETPHAAYLTPEERKLYSSRVQKFDGWLVEVDMAHGAIPLRLWAWDRIYFDGEEVTPVAPMDRIERDTPVMEVEAVEEISSTGYYPMHVVVRRFVPAPGSLSPMPSFEERVLRRGRRFAFPPALGVEREWSVLAVESAVPTPRTIFDSTAVGRVAYDATRLEFPEAHGPTVAVPSRVRTGRSTDSATWIPFAIGCVLAFVAATLAVGLWRRRRWS